MKASAIKARGFTIVELLIVIVVIGILAAITFVSFNGVSARAENTKTLNGVAAYVRAIHAFASENNRYPINGAYPCLGDTGTTCGVTGPGGCFGTGYVGANATFIADIKSVLTQMPEVSKQVLACNGSGGTARGAFYISGDGIAMNIIYYLKGDVSCERPGGLIVYIRNQAFDTTDCRGYLPAP